MIYFIQDSATSRIKIGHAEDPWKRLSHIQCSTPSDVAIVALEPGGAQRETELHEQFAAARFRGEWFSPTAELNEYIRRLGAPVRPTRNGKIREFWGGKTAKAVAAEVGISHTLVSRIQSGQRRPSPEIAVRLQKATGVSAVKLVFGDLLDELEVA